MKIDKPNVMKFREDFKKAVSALEEELDIIIDIEGQIKYSSDNISFKVNVKNNEWQLKPEDFEREEFEKNACFYNFKKEDYLKQVTVNGESFELIGFKPKARKNNCIIRRISDKKTFVMNNVHLKTFC